MRVGRWERAALTALAAVFVDLSVRLAIRESSPLAREEVMHAVAGRALLEGTPATGLELHIPGGMQLLALPGVLAGGSSLDLRVVPVVLSLGALLLLLAFGRWFVGTRPAIAAAVAVTVSAPILADAASLGPMMPAFALQLATLWLVTLELERPGGPTRRLLWAAPLGAAAFYVLYSTLVGSLIIGLVACLVYRDRLARARGVAALTAAAYAVLLLPHFFFSKGATGLDTYTLLWRVARPLRRTGFGEGWRQLWEVVPGEPVGHALTVLALCGLVYVCLGAARGGDRRRRAAFGVALAQLALLATLTPLGPEHALLPFALLALLGAGAIAESFGGSSSHLPCSLSVALVVVFASFASRSGEEAAVAMRRRSVPPVMKSVGEAIRADGSGACAILTSYDLELTWYAGCASYQFKDGVRAAELPAERRYVVLFERGYGQPRGEAEQRLLRELEPEPMLIEGSRSRPGNARVYRVREDGR